MAQPERNDSNVHPAMQKVHGRGVTQRVRGYPLRLQGGTFFTGGSDMARNQSLDRI